MKRTGATKRPRRSGGRFDRQTGAPKRRPFCGGHGEMTRIAIDFALAYLGLILLFLGLSVALEALAGVDIGNAGNLLTLIMASWYAGDRYGKRTGEAPSSATSWGAAFVMLLVSLAYSAVVIGGLLLFFGNGLFGELMDALGTIPSGLIATIILIVLALYFFVPRIFFPIAAKRSAKESIAELADRF